MGTWQPPPNSASAARSAVTVKLVAGSLRKATAAMVSASSLRVSMPSEPCPAAGQNSFGSSRSLTHSVLPRRSRPAAARRMASTWPSASLRRRVSTLPRNSTASMSGRRALSWARRRWLLVPTTAPCGSSAKDKNFTETSASRGSTLGGVAARAKGAGSSVGKSLREWTARWTRPSARASSISLVNMPLEPTWAKVTSWSRSPVVLMISISTSWPWPRRRLAM